MTRYLIIAAAAATLVAVPLRAQEGTSADAGMTATVPGALEAGPEDYAIGPGDVLSVRVIGEPEMTGLYAVRFDGKIMFPYLGEIPAAGVGLAQFNRDLQAGLAGLYRDPQVNVEVKEYGSCVVYVLGEVEKPGVYKFEGRTSLLEIVAAAGGYKHSAARASTMVVRNVATKPEVMQIDMAKVIDDGAITLNVPLRKGDVVVVPKTFITNVNEFLDDVTPSLNAYLRAHDIYFNYSDWNRNQ